MPRLCLLTCYVSCSAKRNNLATDLMSVGVSWLPAIYRVVSIPHELKFIAEQFSRERLLGVEVVHKSESRVRAVRNIPDIRIAIQNGTNNLVVSIV